jgi:K+-transporting ATPase KdpF subunit
LDWFSFCLPSRGDLPNCWNAFKERMMLLYIVAGLIAVALLVYLVVALLKPEMFS